ncbi:hypothetical protein HZH68_008317 [Vespula germanica]|uniref:Uncharacterized protein n=1 Tax=Vespula germanica TaxID=30212 RepID=A0A834N8I8_VESGE|nr:hypothetical protein HZH68_008317 [Vespula germanica]
MDRWRDKTKARRSTSANARERHGISMRTRKEEGAEEEEEEEEKEEKEKEEEKKKRTRVEPLRKPEDEDEDEDEDENDSNFHSEKLGRSTMGKQEPFGAFKKRVRSATKSQLNKVTLYGGDGEGSEHMAGEDYEGTIAMSNFPTLLLF